MAASFIERVESLGPGTAGFSMEGGRATLTLDVVAADLNDAIVELLGSCAARGDGRLTRKLPKAHPRFPALFCERISNIQGLKPQAAKTASQAELEAPPLPFYQEYERYRLTCEFTQRPYAIIGDSQVQKPTVTAYNDAGTSGSYVTAQEVIRYVDVQSDAKPQLITAQQGKMVFLRSDAVSPPHNSSFPGFPRIYLPNGVVKLRWFQVPERYVSSRASHLKKWIGRVNQQTWYQWEKGELLYLGFTQKRYTPPQPLRVPGDSGRTFFVTEKLCDLELLFDETVREIGSPAATAEATNGSWVSGGHNLMPWLGDRKFYYAGNDVRDRGLPTYLSIPHMDLLFTDPDI